MFDCIVKNGRVIDGSGQKAYRADVGIIGNRIASIGDLSEAATARTIDANGRFVTPGFIDAHTHSDLDALTHPQAPNKLKQGVTTEIAGHCGYSLFPVMPGNRRFFQGFFSSFGKNYEVDWEGAANFFTRLEKIKIGFNYVPLVGHGSIRMNALGFEARQPSPGEMSVMRELLVQMMMEGCFGLSSGLAYAPGCFADRTELLELAKAAAGYGGVYSTHMRDQGDHLLESIKESIAIGEQAGLPVVISHIKASGRKNWGKMQQALEIIDAARGRGVDVVCDFYPYVRASSTLVSEFPIWLNDGGMARFLERIGQPAIRRQVIEEMEAEGNIDWSRVWISEVKNLVHKPFKGLSIAEIAADQGKNGFDAAFDLLLAEEGSVFTVSEIMCEEDVRAAAACPYSVLGTDAGLLPDDTEGFKGHPRECGAFPRFLGHYIRKSRLMPLEEAIHKITAAPARFYGILDRGLVKEGCFADLVVLDFERVSDRATYQEPGKDPTGIDYVMVNGQVQVEKGSIQNRPAGWVIKKRLQS